LPRVTNLPDNVADTPLSRLFAGDHALPESKLIHLRGGYIFFDTGEPP
jgi:hypothetical protein